MGDDSAHFWATLVAVDRNCPTKTSGCDRLYWTAAVRLGSDTSSMRQINVMGVLALSANMGISGCVGTAPTATTPPSHLSNAERDTSARAAGEQERPTEQLVRFNGGAAPFVTGRAAPTTDGGIRIAWSGTAATLKFHGSRISVDITDTGDNHYLVLVDGKPQKQKVRPSSGRSTIVLADGLEPKEHSVTLYKLTEPLVGTATIHGFVLDASARPIAPASTSRKRIEILGDSISAGYGNEGESESCGFSPETENHFLTYGALAARTLGTDLTTIAWSGKGVFTNRGSTTDKETLPVLWTRTLPAENIPYDFSDPAPEAVIINLGTNDFAPEVTDFSPFGPSYDVFVEEVRKKYPDAHLFVMMGPLLTDDYPEGRQAYTKARAALTGIVERRTQAGDSKLHFFEVARATPAEGFGCNYHPSTKTHERMAEKLVQELKAHAGF